MKEGAFFVIKKSEQAVMDKDGPKLSGILFAGGELAQLLPATVRITVGIF